MPVENEQKQTNNKISVFEATLKLAFFSLLSLFKSRSNLTNDSPLGVYSNSWAGIKSVNMLHMIPNPGNKCPCLVYIVVFECVVTGACVWSRTWTWRETVCRARPRHCSSTQPWHWRTRPSEPSPRHLWTF